MDIQKNISGDSRERKDKVDRVCDVKDPRNSETDKTLNAQLQDSKESDDATRHMESRTSGQHRMSERRIIFFQDLITFCSKDFNRLQ